MIQEQYVQILSHFPEVKNVSAIETLASGLINQTYKVITATKDTPDYILQCINHHIFQDVELLQHNIECVTKHIRKKLEAQEETEIDRKVLRFLETNTGKTYHFDGEYYWRVCAFIPESLTLEAVTPESAYLVGLKFGEFQAMLSDIPAQLGETIPDFHNMEFRIQQFREAVANDKVGRVATTQSIIEQIERDAEEMCIAERLHREGKLPKRICHCDTKVSNMLFDKDGNVLCVIDLDTVMPSFIFSDFGDFLRSAANTSKEDEPVLEKVNFNIEVFKPFAKGYITSAKSFLTPTEIELLPYAVTLFPYMQAVRFFLDYLNGDTYYRIDYPEHNYVRTLAQWKLYEDAKAHIPAMKAYIEELLKA
ncbi:MAG: aminoglycoside phosphotransferase family protein [Phocaeicola sp.]|nr:aminoglycoside phosphotransferase family protein [Phocaeicola sp.]MDD7448072.1 aminoglycoside phosphotransferase family protein [Prevotellaceae bacterium]MDY3913879.1 aminoglycoside phosphotransferase family protein [Phocaeicola sp.]MDY5938747.1 aminoglycoside phosphotransferase family protein [Phocaeicola sp.]